jgi:molybdate transport system regulatory protein
MRLRIDYTAFAGPDNAANITVVLSRSTGNLSAFWFDVVSRGGLCVRIARRGAFRVRTSNPNTPRRRATSSVIEMPKPIAKSAAVKMSAAKPLPSLSVRIDFDSDSRLGPGKIQLLESIAACGSISAAGRAMDMSYKRAWDLVDEINRMCGQAAVARQTGGKHGGGATLTAFGASLVERYRRIERAAATAARKDLASLRSDIGRGGKVAT